jgi:hypothetical protein
MLRGLRLYNANIKLWRKLIMANLTVGPVRISYANLFEPRQSTTVGAKPKYGVTLLIPKTAKETYAKILAAIEETKQNYKANNPKAAWINNPKTTLYDGDGLRASGEPYGPEAQGHWVLSTSSQRQPLVVDHMKSPILDSSLVYSGCFGLAVINFYAYDTAGNKGLACGINGFMKTADGEKLGGGGVSNADWDNVASDDLAKLNSLLD